jgi:threonylcarbamoyladenosine tRNA methylthiotransferase MtaB
VARFYIENFGCRATQADGAALERQFLERGLERAGAARDAEIVVLNTCTVTDGADKDARASIRRLQRTNPECRILVTGCYAQRAPEELAALPGVTWVVGNSHKHQAAEIATSSFSSHFSSQAPSSGSFSASSGFVPIAQLYGDREGPPPFRKEREGMGHPRKMMGSPSESVVQSPIVVVGDIFAHTELLAAPVFEAANERTRPNLKVQDGCDNRCSFCVIPYVRGQSRSLPMERVIAEVRTLVDAGYREVVISGINLGRWGRDLKSSSQFSVVSSQLRSTIRECRLETLILAILQQTSLQKLRISSVEPMDWSDELIELVAASTRIAKHAHAVGKRCGVAAHASQVPAVALPRKNSEDSSGHANGSNRRRCDGGISG